MIGYDLDGTLADTNFALQKRLSLPQIFEIAEVLHTPTQPFVVITGRQHTTQAERKATLDWLHKNQPNYKAIYYCTGTEQEIIKRKAEIINQLKLTDYYDNNPDIVAELRKLTKATIHKI